VQVLSDAQSLLYVIMAYVAQQNLRRPRAQETGYDLCKFKADFVTTYK
jgi:hypothetical protein